MVVAGTTADAAHAGPITGPAYNRSPASTKAVAPRRVPDDDRTVATIRMPSRSQHSRSGPGQSQDGEQQLGVMQTKAEFVKSSPAAICKGALETTKFQASVEPDRALHLLENRLE